jgi:Wiskott-Aldrich syndrome protein
MFYRKGTSHRCNAAGSGGSAFVGMEGLEGRRMLSAAPIAHHAAKAKHVAPPAHHVAKTAPTKAAPAPPPAQAPQTILFSAAPPVVQAGLQKLAPTGVTIDPSASVKVCKRPDGSTIYITEVSNNGQDVYLSVDANGNAVPPPPPPPPPPGAPAPGQNKQTILFSAAPSIVQSGLQKLAPAGMTIDASANVTVCTRPDGGKIYTTEVSSNGKDVYLSVDANGNPVPPPPPPPPPPGGPKAS